jgi:hypothetical protein
MAAEMTATTETATEQRYFIYLVDAAGGLVEESDYPTREGLREYIARRNRLSSTGAFRPAQVRELWEALKKGEALGLRCDAGYVTVFSPHPLGPSAAKTRRVLITPPAP